MAVFDLLGIPLVHGWLVDPQDAKTAAVFSNKSYNELVEMLFLVRTWAMTKTDFTHSYTGH